MSRDVRRRWRLARDRWYRHALPAYWIFLFLGTHLPNPRLPDLPSSDKLVHIVTFGLLALLWWRFAETFERPPSGRFVWVSAAILIPYASLDEFLQRFVNRGTDWTDWVCDLAGIVGTLAVLEWLRRRKIAALRARLGLASAGSNA